VFIGATRHHRVGDDQGRTFARHRLDRRESVGDRHHAIAHGRQRIGPPSRAIALNLLARHKTHATRLLPDTLLIAPRRAALSHGPSRPQGTKQDDRPEHPGLMSYIAPVWRGDGIKLAIGDGGSLNKITYHDMKR